MAVATTSSPKISPQREKALGVERVADEPLAKPFRGCPRFLLRAVCVRYGHSTSSRGGTMHAVVVRVTIHDREKAEGFLKEHLVPGISQAPGFVTGYWTNIEGNQGASMVVFESEEAAKQVVEQENRPPEDVVTVESVELGEVVAHA